MLESGTHHECWFVLQALFNIASALPVRSTAAVRPINKGDFIGDLAAEGPRLVGTIVG
jgi:hypothetical protein